MPMSWRASRGYPSGADPDELFEETAAGNAATVRLAVVGSSASGFCGGGSHLPMRPWPRPIRRHEARQPGDDLLCGRSGLQAHITITEPQTDNIINADEATGVIIRGLSRMWKSARPSPSPR